ncbi:response regulator transcription factor [Thermophilibacter provencensis]|uniref:response regulator n=1 Tax=Thermophilibacter provencensis TaxID=1852386 RepID=UPI00094B5C3A|nr:response regulator [Thermophilibacter provencensis]
MAKHVLVVEDEPDVLDALVQLLASAGFEVRGERDGLAGLRAFQEALRTVKNAHRSGPQTTAAATSRAAAATQPAAASALPPVPRSPSVSSPAMSAPSCRSFRPGVIMTGGGFRATVGPRR